MMSIMETFDVNNVDMAKLEAFLATGLSSIEELTAIVDFMETGVVTQKNNFTPELNSMSREELILLRLEMLEMYEKTNYQSAVRKR